jgi:iron complex transport system ATP-binding protein
VLGQRLGKVDVRELRTRIGFTSTSLSNMLRPDLRVSDVVVTGKHAALTPFWHNYTDDDNKKALALLKRFGCAQQQNSRLGILSTGEQQRVLLARTLMGDPLMLILDEPAAGLDLGGREKLVSLLNSLALDQNAPSTVLVTHHVDEIPPDFTHVLLLANGRVSTMGPIEQTLTSEALSNCFKIGLNLERRNGRWLAWSTEKQTWII